MKGKKGPPTGKPARAATDRRGPGATERRGPPEGRQGPPATGRAGTSGKHGPPATGHKGPDRRKPDAPRRERRALTHVGGAIDTRGDAQALPGMVDALRVVPDEDAVRAHVHGFHSYPARMHPETASRLVRAFSPPGGTVMDPFCGSGTVLVEARLAGRAAIGSDLSPLAVRLAGLKAEGRDKARRDLLRRAVARVVEASEERTRQRVGASRRYEHEDVAAFAPHVLLELDGLSHAIDQEPDDVRGELGLVLSSILTKLERRSGDSVKDLLNKKVPRKFATHMFERRADELLRQLSQYERKLPSPQPAARVVSADARRLAHVEDASVDLVVTSPPYPGTYDYLDHHATRMRWLGLSTEAFAHGEMGSRRAAKAAPHLAESQWLADFGAVLGEIARLLRPEGKAFVLVGDSTAGERALRNDRTTELAAAKAGLRVAAVASQARPHFHAGTARAFLGAPRKEHLILLVPDARTTRADAPPPRPRRVVSKP